MLEEKPIPKFLWSCECQQSQLQWSRKNQLIYFKIVWSRMSTKLHLHLLIMWMSIDSADLNFWPRERRQSRIWIFWSFECGLNHDLVFRSYDCPSKFYFNFLIWIVDSNRTSTKSQNRFNFFYWSCERRLHLVQFFLWLSTNFHFIRLVA